MDEYNNDLEEPSRKAEDVPSEQTNRPGYSQNNGEYRWSRPYAPIFDSSKPGGMGQPGYQYDNRYAYR